MRTLKTSRMKRAKVRSRVSKKSGRTTKKPLGAIQIRNSVEFRAYYPQADMVQLAGDFNNWQPQPMRKIRGGVWTVKLPLATGTYRYRFVVDGRWQQDPNNNAAEPNPFGEFNSVVNVN